MPEEQGTRATFQSVNKVLSQFHESGVLNLDKSVREVMAPSEALASLDPGGEVATAVVAWDGYGLVIKSQTQAQELTKVADQLRRLTGGIQ